MAVDKKISQLTSLAQVDVSASTDVLPIVDTSATETKKITVSALVGAGATAGISGAVLTNGTINSTTIGATTPSTGAFTTLSASGNLTLSGGTANGVLYLNGSKVATSGSALTFDGTNLATTGAARIANASGNKVLYLGQSSPSANDGASFEFQASNTQTNWAIRTNFNVAGALEFCPSLSAGGTTYTSPLMLLSSSGNLGIGTTSPDAKLSVNGVASFGAGTAALPSVAQFGDLDTGRWSPAANTLAWSTGGSERMRIDSSGNLIVGGTSAAQFSLQTNYSTWDSTNIYIGMGMNLYGGASSAGTTFKNSAGLSWTSSYWTGSANATEQFVAGVKRTAASQDSHSWQFWSSSGGGNRQMLDFGPGTLAFYTNGSERMRLDSSGNLGIGTTSPTQLVQARKDQAAYTWMRVENQSSNASAYAGLAIGAFGNSWGWTVGSTAANSNALNLVVDAGGSNSPIATFSTSGNVGIGTTGPSTRLNVVGGASRFQGSGNAGRIEVFDSDNSNQSRILINPAYNLLEPAIQVSTNTPLLFATSNTERMRIDASGNVGINTTSPGSLYSGANNLVVGGGSGNTGMTVYSGTTGTGRLFFADGTVGADAYRGWVEYGHTSNNLTFGTDGATRITVDSSGNVGVGNTPTAGFRLDLQAALAYQRIESTTGTNGVQSRMVNTGGTFYRAIDNSTGANFGAAYSAVLWHTGNYPMLFATNNTERARITASGYFKASTAGTYSSSSGTYHELRVTGADNNWLAVASNTTTTAGNAYGISVQYTGAAPNGTGNQFLNCADTVGTRADIRSNGGLANYQANDVNLSDQRVKKDIKPLGSMWDKFKALEIVTFKYKDQTHDDDNIGVIAQQVESVAPEFIDTDGFGKTPEDGVPLKTVYTTDMYHAAIKALQEAMARIEQLEAKVAVLENK